jgi:enoyl-[acyl-carrier protein] reductase II
MAAAFALGAEGVQMGTRMVAAAESPVHAHWKQAIIDAAETDTVFLNQFSKPALRALRTAKTSAYEQRGGPEVMAEFARAKELYFGGDMEASIALCGQVCGRIRSVQPVAAFLGETIQEFYKTIDGLAAYRNR